MLDRSMTRKLHLNTVCKCIAILAHHNAQLFNDDAILWLLDENEEKFLTTVCEYVFLLRFKYLNMTIITFSFDCIHDI